MGNKQRLLYFKENPKNLKAADLKPTAKCVYEGYFLRLWVFQKKATREGKYIVGRAWINKQQHCVQCEIKKLVTCDDPISAIVFSQNLKQLTSQHLAFKFSIFKEFFVNLKLFIPSPEQRVCFENLCFKITLFYAGNLRIYVGT